MGVLNQECQPFAASCLLHCVHELLLWFQSITYSLHQLQKCQEPCIGSNLGARPGLCHVFARPTQERGPPCQHGCSTMLCQCVPVFESSIVMMHECCLMLQRKQHSTVVPSPLGMPASAPTTCEDSFSFACQRV